MALLIDTSIFIQSERAQVNSSMLSQEVAMASITASELLHGVHRAESVARRERRRAFVESILTRVPILSFDLGVARSHAELWADLQSRGQPIGAHDLIIAATAMHHGLQLATCNVREFRRVPGLVVLPIAEES